MINQSVIKALGKTRDSFFLYDQTTILDRISRLREDFPGVSFLYSVKANPHPQVLRTIFGAGIGADAASLGEVEMAASLGLGREDIQFSAPGRSDAALEGAWDRAVITADSLYEVRRLADMARRRGEPIDIGLRVNPAFGFDSPDAAPNKFGVDEEQIIAAAPWIRQEPYLRIVGFHIHLKSQERRKEVLLAYYKNCLSVAMELQAVLGCELEFINLGSGIGIPYGTGDTPLDTVGLGRDLTELWGRCKKFFPKARLCLETGRFLVGQSGGYVTRVMDKKVSQGKIFLILNNTLNGFLRPSLARLVEFYAGAEVPVGTEPLFTQSDAFAFLPIPKRGETEVVTLAGNLCTGADVMARDCLLPRMEPGDLVVVTNAGSYAAVLSPMQFSSQVPPEELFLSAEGQVLDWEGRIIDAQS
ncbi:MAG: alanine racemase [Ruminiclostridium sp.]|nr:alanine racemase [Ruminiclostridium sp.]